jgi:hypothetical protein
MNLFFEALILDVLGRLPPDRDTQIEAMKIGPRLKTKATAWRDAVRESLHLSETIDIAILDLWYRNREAFLNSNQEYLPEDFARDFVDKYFEEGSKVDVWPGDSLQQAKRRVAKYQAVPN